MGVYDVGAIPNSADGRLAGEVHALVEGGCEGEYWDFKKQWHASNADLIFDIINLANNSKGVEALLIIGVEEGPVRYVGVSKDDIHRKNSQQLINLLSSVSWGTKSPAVRVVTVKAPACAEGPGGEGDIIIIDVIVITPEEDAVPYYLAKEYKKKGNPIPAGKIFVRHGDSNTGIDQTASPMETEQLWRRHFGINRSPRERVLDLLFHPEDWQTTCAIDSQWGESADGNYCHKYFPEFRVYFRPVCDCEAWVPIMLADPFARSPCWYEYAVFYHQTQLEYGRGCMVDHYFVPLGPDNLSLKPVSVADAFDLAYPIAVRYQRSFEAAIECFYSLKHGLQDSPVRCEVDRMLPVFASAEEKSAFERKIQENPECLSACEVGTGFCVSHVELEACDMNALLNRAQDSCRVVKLLHKWHEDGELDSLELPPFECSRDPSAISILDFTLDAAECGALHLCPGIQLELGISRGEATGALTVTFRFGSIVLGSVPISATGTIRPLLSNGHVDILECRILEVANRDSSQVRVRVEICVKQCSHDGLSIVGTV